MSQKLVTVDDDVNVIASTAPVRTRSRSSGIAGPRQRFGTPAARRPRSRALESFGQHVARQPRPARAARVRRVPTAPGTRRATTRRRSARARGRRGRRGVASASAVPGPIAATRTGASARASSPAGARPRSKNASTPLADVNTSHAYAPRSGSAKSTGSIAIDGSSITSAPSASSLLAQLARLFARARHDDAPAEQRALLEPREVERGDVADDDRRRCLDAGGGDRRERRAHRALLGARAPTHRGDRCVGRAAARRSTRVAMASSRPAPMRIDERAAAAAPVRPSRCRSFPWSGSSWPVTIVTLVETPRCVTGIPA